mgnify:CR=1 FL=1
MLLAASGQLYADEGMWVLKELNKQNLARMAELGFTPSYDQLYSETDPCVANAVVIFGGGCTGITVSDEGLIFTNHHCGFGSIQQLSSVEHDYLKDGFVSQSKQEELPVPGLSVRYLKETVDVSDRINSQIAGIEDEFQRLSAADSIGRVICDSVGNSEFQAADVVPFYNNNKYFLVVYDVFRDVRMVFAPPSSIGKFGGDTDNWMWPRHTGDFSVFRVYANADNKPAEYNADNKPYTPRYVAEVSMQGYQDKDYAMTIGFPGSTDRYLCSWGVQQRIENSNKPRIEVRGIKQGIWKEAMSASDAVRIKYASKYAGSSNYWKNSIGVNRTIKKLHVLDKKRAMETELRRWIQQTPEEREHLLHLFSDLELNYKSRRDAYRARAYFAESFLNGPELVQLALSILNFDFEGEEKTVVANLKAIVEKYANLDLGIDKEVFTALLKEYRSQVDSTYLPELYQTIATEYGGNERTYVDSLYARSELTTPRGLKRFLEQDTTYQIYNDPAINLGIDLITKLFEMNMQVQQASGEIERNERLFNSAVRRMYASRNFYPDANSTMRLSFGTVCGYAPFDGAEYDYYTTAKGILEKVRAHAGDVDFEVQPELLSLLSSGDFGRYADEKGEMNVCFISNNDITGGNSGSAMFNAKGELLGLAFDGNWEAMSSDILYEPKMQRTIGVDVRYILFMIEKYGKAGNLIQELKLANP